MAGYRRLSDPGSAAAARTAPYLLFHRWGLPGTASSAPKNRQQKRLFALPAADQTGEEWSTQPTLVEEIYKAQRERDQAVMARLRLANEERDEALLRAKRLQEASAELENINPEVNDADLEELLNRINSAESALGIDRSGAVIVDRLQKARERRKKITAEEMNAVIEERDAALAKCRRLEQDLHHAKEQSQTSANSARHPTVENNQELARKHLNSSLFVCLLLLSVLALCLCLAVLAVETPAWSAQVIPLLPASLSNTPRHTGTTHSHSPFPSLPFPSPKCKQAGCRKGRVCPMPALSRAPFILFDL
ncbi:hypothetical protein JZ751_002713 [Albula glossodonta]|uniref:Mirror-image polydactyly 1 n=1 Tax=Albula glossodonta TaxID=121402 RepID=A0A8T2N8V8_9TELE|nr:hypothetical protein JZ751_002713 [Albula glossodonta]